jgi:hypothetical protein
MRCRPGIVTVRGGPGSAVHRFADARAAPRPGHAIASDPFGALFTFQTAHLVPAARFLRPGLATLLRSPESRGGRSAERRSGAQRNTRAARHLASKTRVNALMTRHARGLRGALRPMTRDARLSALHRGDFGLPGPRFRLLGRPPSYNGGQVPCGSVQRAPRTQVVVPGGRGPEPPEANGYEPPPQDATPRSAFRIVSGDAPQ